MSKKTLAIMVLAAIIVGTVLWRGRDDGASPMATLPDVAVTPTTVVVVNRHVETPYAVADVSYPSFPALPELSQWIASFVDDRIAEHAATSQENYAARTVGEDTPAGDVARQEPLAADRFTLDVTWTPGEISDALVSVALNGYDYSGGAHGGTWTQTYAYDVATRKILTVQDLVARYGTTLAVLAQSARTTLAEDLQQRSGEATLGADLRQMLDEGTAPTEENYQAFIIDRDRVTFTFGQYQIAPYAFGTFTYLWTPRQDTADDVADEE